MTKVTVSISVPPMPVTSFAGRCSTSSMRGTTPANSARTRVETNFRSAGTAVTTSTSTPAVSSPAMTVRDGDSDGVFSVPVMKPKVISSRMCEPRPTSCEAPTLATASPGRTPAFCR